MNSTEKGIFFESQAETFFRALLKQQGYKLKLLQRHFYYKGGEIDFIFLAYSPHQTRELHFLEVRGNMKDSHTFNPLLSLTPQKINRIKKGVDVYLLKHPLKNASIQIGFLYFYKNKWNYIPNLIFI